MELIIKNSNKKSLKFVFFILIFSSTLFFDNQLGFNGFVPIGVSVSILLAISLGIMKVSLNDYIVVVFLLICALGTLVLTYGYWYSDFAQIKNFFFLLLGLLCYLVVKSIINKLDSKEVSGIVNIVIFFHCFIFFSN